jgi:hypothetical protein
VGYTVIQWNSQKKAEPVEPRGCGPFWRWNLDRFPDRKIPYYIDKHGSKDLLLPQVREAVEQSFQAWKQPAGVALDFRFAGYVDSVGFKKDGKNVIFWDEKGEYFQPDATGVEALATTRHVDVDFTTGEIREADIALNGSYIRPAWKSASSRCAGLAFNTPIKWSVTEQRCVHEVGAPLEYRAHLQSTLTHEIGHLLGLGHSGSPEATMFGGGFGDNTDQSTLQPDDIRGVRFLYPSDVASKPADATSNTTSAWQGKVDSRRCWQSTGLMVKTGEVVQITASGRVTWDPSPNNQQGTVGPDGYGRASNMKNKPWEFPVQDAGVGSLIMKIGDTTYPAGENARVISSRSGTVEFMVNDQPAWLFDNAGSFGVRAQIVPASPQAMSQVSVRKIKIDDEFWRFEVTLPAGQWVDTGIPVIVFKNIRIRTEHKEPRSEWRMRVSGYEFARNRVTEEAFTLQISEGPAKGDAYGVSIPPQDSPTLQFYLNGTQSTRLEITIKDSGRCLQCIVGCPDEHKRLHEQGEVKAARLLAKIGN